jgi:hypothetical protein
MTLSVTDAERLVEVRLRDLETVFEPKDLVIDRGNTREYAWGWVIPYGTRSWIERGDPNGVLVGPGFPFCVVRATGQVETLVCRPSRRAMEAALRKFERMIGARPWWKVW